MSETTSDYVIVGGGIVGLATALQLSRARPGASITVLEKESRLAEHQTGRNSGVIHSGIYYKPGSLKAAMCKGGARSMVEFCAEHGIAHEVTGKLIVATERDELGRLGDLHDRAVAHGIPVERLGPDGIRDHEPHCAGIAALWLTTTGIADYRAVTETYARLATENGVEVTTASKVTRITDGADQLRLEVRSGADARIIHAARAVNCGGLHSDRIARGAGADLDARIVPFRGEYFELTPAARPLVKGLIYPVPDPSFPFLGVHLTRGVDGGVHAGPNAVLALAREGYRWRDVNLRDTADTLRFPGFWRLARKHYRSGAAEVARSLSTKRFLHSLQRLVPELRREHLVPAAAGVRAQALKPDGGLVDDFLMVESSRMLHVCNAPSPAATSSLEIGRSIAERVTAG